MAATLLSPPTIGIIVNGDLPVNERLAEVWQQSKVVISTDGAVNSLMARGHLPHIVVGDLDSLDPRIRELLPPSVEVVEIPCQDSTDLEKAFRLALERGASEVVVAGIGGGRLDHAITNLAILHKFRREVPIRLIEPSGYGILMAAENCHERFAFKGPLGRTVSLVPFGAVEEVRTVGLRYPLNGESLTWGVREGQSNEAVAEEVVIEIRSGVLLVFSDEAMGRAE
jgi:thiamine pyrophosphokinase